MLRQPITSSAMRSVGYDAQQQILEIEFPDRNVHWFVKVPEELYLGLLRAPSAGTYFNDHIKGRYQSFWVKLTTFDMGTSASAVAPPSDEKKMP